MKIKLFFSFTILTVLALQISADVIKIHDFEELKKIGKHPDFPLDGNYELAGNIDASDSRNINNGKGFEPIGKMIFDSQYGIFTPDSAFTGIFYGKNFVISNLYIKSIEDYVGLFGVVKNGEIKAIGLEDVFIEGNHFVGALIGYSIGGTIMDCYSAGDVSSRGNFVGGLVGAADSATTIAVSYSVGNISSFGERLGGLVGSSTGKIIDCYFTGSVSGLGEDVGGLIGYIGDNSQIINCYSTGFVSGSNYVGGLLGKVYTLGSFTTNGSTIINCYSTAFVNGDGLLGGLVGALLGHSTTITNCYSTGSVSGTDDYIGGFIGESFSGGTTVINCFWDTETSKQNSSARGEGRTTAQMKQQATYTGWDFDNIWAIDEGEDYPYLLSLGKTQTPTSVIEIKISRNTTVAPVPLIIIKNKTLTIKSTSTSDLQIRLFDMRGKTLARFNTRGNGSNSFSLAKIPAGRYLIETKENGKRVGVSAVVLR